MLDSMYCPSCDSNGAVVPIKNQYLKKERKGGNPYRLQCRTCDSILKMISEETYRNSVQPYRITDKNGDIEPVPDEEQYHNCPNCSWEFQGKQKSCPSCSVELEWMEA